eukprot:2612292-Alexandrium_andersonii.AAC.1
MLKLRLAGGRRQYLVDATPPHCRESCRYALGPSAVGSAPDCRGGLPQVRRAPPSADPRGLGLPRGW